MKIVVLGADGMLGHKVFGRLIARYPETTGTLLSEPSEERAEWARQFPAANLRVGVNCMELPDLRRVLRDIRPVFLVNCVGIVKQRDAATQAIPSITLNSLLPHLLAEWSREWGGRLIHFSTDCVFNGRRGAYCEDDVPDAEDLYGRSKALGEVQAGNALTLRTSIIGRELMNYRSLLEWFLSQQGQQVNGYVNAIYAGVTTNYVADVVANVIAEMPELHGLYQVASQPIPKYHLLCKLKTAYGLDVEIVPETGTRYDRSMNGNRFEQATGWITPCWDQLVTDLANDETPYNIWRRK